MAEWLQDESFSLLNVHNYPMFHHHNHTHHLVCDLTMANTRAIGWSLVSNWRVDKEVHTSSNHVVIHYTIANKRVSMGETIRECPNWKKVNEEDYSKAFRAALDKRKDKLASIMNQAHPTMELEEAADAL